MSGRWIQATPRNRARGPCAPLQAVLTTTVIIVWPLPDPTDPFGIPKNRQATCDHVVEALDADHNSVLNVLDVATT